MQWLTLLGLTVPLVVGFLVMGGIVVVLGILGAELYSENDADKKLRDHKLMHPVTRKAHRLRRNLSTARPWFCYK